MIEVFLIQILNIVVSFLSSVCQQVLFSSSNLQVARMLIINGVVYFVCLAPFQFINFHGIIDRLTGRRLLNPYQHNVMIWFGRSLSVLNSAINPVIYGVTNSKYRQAFQQVLLCSGKAAGKKRNDINTVTGSSIVTNEI